MGLHERQMADIQHSILEVRIRGGLEPIDLLVRNARVQVIGHLAQRRSRLTVGYAAACARSSLRPASLSY